MNLVASCAFALETPLKWELERLGYKPKVIQPGQVLFQGDWLDICKTNLWLRIADRVQIQVAEFDAPDFDALFDSVRDLNWSHWIPKDGRFPVHARSRHSMLTSIPAIQRSTKRAIVEALYRDHQTDSLSETGPAYRVETVLLKDHARILIDTTGHSLHKRGYRHLVATAPIKETMAAAMVQLSVWNPERPLIDPFCGSGTIPIEAALIGLNIAPGLEREFSSQHWPQIENDLWTLTQDRARSEIRSDVTLQINGTDIDPEVLKLSRIHAERAGVAQHIHFQEKPFDELRSKKEYGCVITNPPYGERLDEARRLKPLYQTFPQILQRLPTWSHFIITNMPRFEPMLQKSATRRRKLFNGRIECTYYQFLGPRPPTIRKPIDEMGHTNAFIESNGDSASDASRSELKQSNKSPGGSPPVLTSPPKQPVFGGLQDVDNQQADLFGTRLKKRAKHLRRWPTRRGITCFRIYERDIPELPFVVDLYEDHLHIMEFERPHDRDMGRHGAWLELMKKAASKALDIPIQRVHFKTRLRQKGLSQHQKQGHRSKRIEVHEGGLSFLVNLDDYVDTGLFLDHRTTRQMVRDEARDKKFLNLFAYTGSFSVYAAAGGARSTCTVDWSNTYLDWAQANMRLNGFTDDHHQFRRENAVGYISQVANRSKAKFDLVVVDPPTFSNSKRTEQIWDIQRDHASMLRELSRIVEPGGTVYFSTNFRKFKLEASALVAYRIIELSKQTVPEDFRNKRIHQCWKLIREADLNPPVTTPDPDS